jgi:hypothetical protein
VEKLTPWFIGAFVGVSAKIVALSLQQVGWQTFATETVKIAKR